MVGKSLGRVFYRRFLRSKASALSTDSARAEGSGMIFNSMVPVPSPKVFRSKLISSRLEPSAQVPERVPVVGMIKPAPIGVPLSSKEVPERVNTEPLSN